MRALPEMTLSRNAEEFIDDARLEALLHGGSPDASRTTA